MDVVLGLDIGGTYTKFGLVDSAGNLHKESRIETAKHPDPSEFVEKIFNYVQDLIGNENFTILGVGIGGSQW